MELTDVDLGVRLVSLITNIMKEQLVIGNLRIDQGNQLLAAIERLSRSRLHIVFGWGNTTSDVRAYALQVQATEGLKPALIVADYVQLLRDEEGDGRMRERDVSAAARGLRRANRGRTLARQARPRAHHGDA